MRLIPVAISIAIAQLAGIIGSVFTSNSANTWYNTINRPTWNPPSWIFGPVWITLYTLMGISAYIVWKSNNPKKKQALTIYGVHLVLNTLWSILFFGLQNPELAFYEIILLLLFIIITIVMFWRINKWAGILLLPYLAWVSFASYLNYTIWQLN